MQSIIETLGPMGPILILGVLGALLVLGAIALIARAPKDPMARLAQQVSSQGGAGRDVDGGALRRDGKDDKLEKFSNFLEPQDAKQLSAMKLQLVRAGYRGKNAVRMFHAIQFGLAIGLLLAGGLYVAVLHIAGNPPDNTWTAIYMLGPALIGYMIPKRWLNKRLEQRADEIQSGFPDALDMMLVCVEAGQSMDQCIARVASEIKPGYPALGEEFEIVSHELKAGKDKVEVFKSMSERCGVQDVTSFVTVLIQSQTFGTPISDALRVYASEMRDKRVMRAEEKANTIPTKMTLATMGLTVPPLLIVLLAPSVIMIMTSMGGG